ncbi:hypothetical protein LNTAR_22294 [Lentisphaera araneosa HTCC2155]|uniref:Uncharacterized protein n=1 Tax=Lentisphaera araneosa HTCC2155 TaxID=313628 RepID=A6DG50_9BACT|nr:hypothetical protein LNTAR_22294 [Lentisphaera araneosa HTCC2155]
MASVNKFMTKLKFKRSKLMLAFEAVTLQLESIKQEKVFN